MNTSTKLGKLVVEGQKKEVTGKGLLWDTLEMFQKTKLSLCHIYPKSLTSNHTVCVPFRYANKVQQRFRFV